MTRMRGGAAAGLAAGTMLIAGGVSALPTEVTHQTVLVEEYTATWCDPCQYAYDALQRAKNRWGEAISILTYNVSDSLANSYTESRASEWDIAFIPTFVFHCTYKQVGTPNDQVIDNYITQTRNQPQILEVIGSYLPRQAQNDIRVRLKIRGDQQLNATHELRLVVWEETYDYRWYRDNFHYKVIGGEHITLPTIGANKVVKGVLNLDLSSMGHYQELEDLGVTLYLLDKVTERALASWDIGAVSLGDLNGDLDINKTDVNLFKQQQGKTANDPDFNPAADWNGDDVIDSQDTDLFRDYVLSGGLL